MPNPVFPGVASEFHAAILERCRELAELEWVKSKDSGESDPVIMLVGALDVVKGEFQASIHKDGRREVWTQLALGEKNADAASYVVRPAPPELPMTVVVIDQGNPGEASIVNLPDPRCP